jgi:hypothetical protein
MATRKTPRLFRALTSLVRAGVRSPTKGRELGRAAGAFILDLHFATASPLPVAPVKMLDQLGQHEVTLPAAGLMGPGNQPMTGLAYLVTIAKTLNARTLFEIGTYNGVTAFTLALNLPDATVHTLDLPADAEPALRLGSSDASNIIPFATRAYEGRPEGKRVVQHFSDSATFDYAPFRDSCDLVYVDGAHSLEYVRNDSEAAFEMVGDRGAIIWDDYWRRLPDVATFLHSLDRGPLFRLPGSRLVAWFAEPALRSHFAFGHDP